jgi:diguanylate cyclase (GGDEF)-like protein/PAS domain S-box-containing protein
MKNDPMSSSGNKFRAGLALKITGIVFWGLVVFGVTLVFFLSRNLQRQEIAQQEAMVDRLALRTQALVLKNPSIPLTALAAPVNKLASDLGLAAAELRAPGAAATGDTARPGLVHTQRAIMLTTGGVAVLGIYYRDPFVLVKEQRKNLLVTLGGLFLVFGFVLQWVLHRVLTQPFLRMVETAEAISRGNEQRRFAEDRTDEFGFLATFINKSLDFLVQQARELADALAKVRKSEADLFHEKERAVVTLHSIGDAVITTDTQGRIEYLNPVAERMTGLGVAEAHGRSVQEVIRIVYEGTHEPVNNPLTQCLKDMKTTALDQGISLVRDDGHVLAISATASPILGNDGAAIGAVMVFQDVTLTRELGRQLAFQAAHDPLTGLCNRREFEIHLQAALENTRNENIHHALCYLDLDQFKVVNDTCGHTAGDELLRQLADLLKRKVRETDLLARLGGDELGLLLRYCDIDKARAIADDIRRSIKEFRFAWVGHAFEIGASIGVVAIDSGSKNVSELMSAADVACYMAKDQGRNRVHVYQPDDNELTQRRGEMRWVSRITHALNHDRLCLFYQPITRVSADAKALPHYEILLRLRDEAGSLVPPTAFIPAAERYDLISALDRWVIHSTFAHIRAQAKRNEGIYAINLSGQSMDDEFLKFVETELDAAAIDPRHICFEITETAAIANFTRAARLIERLKKRGCSFALDDFGCGVSSLAYLKNLNVDYLKIDGNFIRNMVHNPVDYAMVEAICRIGHVMGLQIVAECVENQATLDAVATLGIDFAQGFHIAKVRPVDEWPVGRKKSVRN